MSRTCAVFVALLMALPLSWAAPAIAEDVTPRESGQKDQAKVEASREGVPDQSASGAEQSQGEQSQVSQADRPAPVGQSPQAGQPQYPTQSPQALQQDSPQGSQAQSQGQQYPSQSGQGQFSQTQQPSQTGTAQGQLAAQGQIEPWRLGLFYRPWQGPAMYQPWPQQGMMHPQSWMHPGMTGPQWQGQQYGEMAQLFRGQPYWSGQMAYQPGQPFPPQFQGQPYWAGQMAYQPGQPCPPQFQAQPYWQGQMAYQPGQPQWWQGQQFAQLPPWATFGPMHQWGQPPYQGHFWHSAPPLGYQPGAPFQPTSFEGGQSRFHPEDTSASRTREGQPAKMQETQAPRMQEVQAPKMQETQGARGESMVGGQPSGSGKPSMSDVQRQSESNR